LENVPEDKKRITIHELLTHTSGIVSDVASDTERLGKQELLTRIFRSKLQFDPGSRFAYSNAGYSLLAAIIDRVSGLSYADFMREEVFKPLGMSNTGSTGMAFFKQLHVTNGYYNGKDYGKLSEYPLSWNGLIGNGDILSTPKDMSSLFRNLFAGKLLTPANLAKVLTPYVAEGDGGDYFYGYGWDIRTDERDGKIIGHNGGGMSGNHIVTYYEKYGLAVLVFNTRLDERLLFGKFPYDIDYPSDQLSEAIIANLFSGKYDRMPSPILPLWLGVAKYSGIVCVLLGICAALAMFVRRRLVRRR
jgi:CubicO group peptidase (beta-lactamase class C family)